MKKKLLVLNTTVMLGLGSVFAIPGAQAETLSSIKGQRASIQQDLRQANQDLYLVQNEIATINQQIKRAEEAIRDNQKMIAKTEKDITSAQEEIKKLEAEVASLKQAIEKRTEIIKERAITYQETGGNVRYFDVLLGSTSFGDFVERVSVISTLINADKDLLEQHETDQKAVEKKQASVKGKLGDPQALKTELEGMRAHIDEQKEQNDLLKAELKKIEAAGLAVKNDLQKQDRSLAAKETQLLASLAPKKPNNNQGNNSSSYPVVSVPKSVSGKIGIVTNVGKKYIGNSVYVFGGGRNAYDVANGRFDCSGFVAWAFSQAGIKLSPSTDSMKYAGRSVSRSQMRPGDLVFFNTYKTDGHVGIYLGGGKFIGSQNSTGVAIADLTTGYWKSKFNGRVKRIIE